jgi:hypothetical protein
MLEPTKERVTAVLLHVSCPSVEKSAASEPRRARACTPAHALVRKHFSVVAHGPRHASSARPTTVSGHVPQHSAATCTTTACRREPAHPPACNPWWVRHQCSSARRNRLWRPRLRVRRCAAALVTSFSTTIAIPTIAPTLAAGAAAVAARHGRVRRLRRLQRQQRQRLGYRLGQQARQVLRHTAQLLWRG